MYSNSVLKRLFDVILSLLGLVLALPLIIVCAIAIRLESKGSPFYKQLRAGKNNIPFEVYKLRTMIQDADKVGPILTQENDQRVTRVGWFLRRTALDELPQIFNVLKGEMSLVGPQT